MFRFRCLWILQTRWIPSRLFGFAPTLVCLGFDGERGWCDQKITFYFFLASRSGSVYIALRFLWLAFSPDLSGERVQTRHKSVSR